MTHQQKEKVISVLLAVVTVSVSLSVTWYFVYGDF